MQSVVVDQAGRIFVLIYVRSLNIGRWTRHLTMLYCIENISSGSKRGSRTAIGLQAYSIVMFFSALAFSALAFSALA